MTVKVTRVKVQLFVPLILLKVVGLKVQPFVMFYDSEGHWLKVRKAHNLRFIPTYDAGNDIAMSCFKVFMNRGCKISIPFKSWNTKVKLTLNRL